MTHRQRVKKFSLFCLVLFIVAMLYACTNSPANFQICLISSCGQEDAEGEAISQQETEDNEADLETPQ